LGVLVALEGKAENQATTARGGGDETGEEGGESGEAVAEGGGKGIDLGEEGRLGQAGKDVVGDASLKRSSAVVRWGSERSESLK